MYIQGTEVTVSWSLDQKRRQGHSVADNEDQETQARVNAYKAQDNQSSLTRKTKKVKTFWKCQLTCTQIWTEFKVLGALRIAWNGCVFTIFVNLSRVETLETAHKWISPSFILICVTNQRSSKVTLMVPIHFNWFQMLGYYSFGFLIQ